MSIFVRVRNHRIVECAKFNVPSATVFWVRGVNGSVILAVSGQKPSIFQSQCSKSCSPAYRYRKRDIIEHSPICEQKFMEFRQCEGLVSCPKISDQGQIESYSWSNCRSSGNDYIRDLKVRNRNSGQSIKVTYPCIDFGNNSCTVS